VRATKASAGRRVVDACGGAGVRAAAATDGKYSGGRASRDSRVDIVGERIAGARQEHLENLVVGVAGRIADVGGKDGIAADIREGRLRIPRRREHDVLITAVNLDRAGNVFGEQHHAGVVGDRRGETARKFQVLRRGERGGRNGVVVAGVYRVERELAVGEGDIAPELELVGAARPIVQFVAAKSSR
jgi:hypothetical protein